MVTTWALMVDPQAFHRVSTHLYLIANAPTFAATGHLRLAVLVMGVEGEESTRSCRHDTTAWPHCVGRAQFSMGV